MVSFEQVILARVEGGIAPNIYVTSFFGLSILYWCSLGTPCMGKSWWGVYIQRQQDSSKKEQVVNYCSISNLWISSTVNNLWISVV